MLTSIHIQGFKNFKDTKIEPLRKVNLILGGQNVGKTSLLEAVYYKITNNQNISDIFRIAEGGDWKRFMGAFLKNPPIIQLSDFSPKSALAISLNLPNQSDIVKLIDNVVWTQKEELLINLLHCIEPRLTSVRSLSPDGELRVYIGLRGLPTMIPLQQLGHGFSRLFYLYCSLLVTDSKLALIDEIENGIHYSSLPTMFKGIQQIATNNDIQSLITTHSWECLRAACEVFSDKPELFQVIRLERDGDNTKAVCIEGERMLRMMERDMEVR